MADRLGLGPEVRQLKLGTTFTNSRTNAFHSIRCTYYNMDTIQSEN